MAKQKQAKITTNKNGSRVARWAAAALAVVLIAGAGAALLYHSQAATGTATLSISPTSSVLTVGNTLSVTINVNSGTDNVSTVQADLVYPSALLQYKSIDATGSQFNDVVPAPAFGTGTISITRATTSLVSGTQQFVTVNFTVLAAGTATVGFANTSAVYRQSDAINIYTTGTSGVYTLQLPPVTGDVNGDRHVNAADIAVILSHWNQTGVTKAQGDLSGDGKVTAVDIAILLTNWGV